MRTVRDILNRKGSEIWSVPSDTKVYDVLRLMADKNIGAVLVIDNDGLKGIFSERDYARKVVLKGKSSHELPVEEIMSKNVLFVIPERSAEECMALMTDKHIRHLPVYEEDKLVGLISIGDIVKALLYEKNYMISQLEQYITNRI